MKRKYILPFSMTCVVLGAAMLYYSHHQHHLAQQHLQHAQQLQQQYQTKMQQYEQQQQQRQLYQPAYLALQQLSVGSEPRLMWLEQLRKLSYTVKQLYFEIGPQQAYPGKTTPWQLHYSPMKLQLALLHEQQLLHFFQALKQHIPQWYQLESCSLQRTALHDQPLLANCQGGWITLAENK